MNTLFLVDSKSRQFSATSYLDLKSKGFSVTSKDCPFTLAITVNPGLSVDETLCYEIPKEKGLSYSLKLYSTLPELCEEPLFDCQILTFPIEISQSQAKSSSRIPEWVTNIFRFYVEGKISEDELIGALQFLIKEGILKVN